LTLVFDCPFEVASGRLARLGRTMDRFEREDRAFFDRVRNSYLEATSREPGRMHLIDASKSLEEVKLKVEEILLTL